MYSKSFLVSIICLAVSIVCLAVSTNTVFALPLDREQDFDCAGRNVLYKGDYYEAQDVTRYVLNMIKEEKKLLAKLTKKTRARAR